jgi:hypothetical protein
MAILPWPEWLPDQPDFQSKGSPVIKNVMPLTPGSYGPMPTAVPHSTNVLSSRCQGSYSLKAEDGTVYLFAGDQLTLQMMPPGSRAFEDVSRATGGAYATPSPTAGGFWSMTSFGNRVLATNSIDEVQSLMIPPAPGGKFDALSVDAPRGRYIAVVKDFVFLGGTTDPVDGFRPNRVWWSGLNQPDYWPTPGSIEALAAQSDYQDLQQTDLGEVTGLVPGFSPGADVLIFCERGIYTASYVGPPLLFNFRVAQGASGTVAPLSIVMAHARDNSGMLRPMVYYLGDNGFCAFDGVTSFPIGAQKFDRKFFTDLDDTHIKMVQGTRDPRSRSIIWGFPTIGSSTADLDPALFGKMLVYNWELGRASLVELEENDQIEWLTSSMFSTSYDLDHIDSFGDLETIKPPFDDPFWTGNATSRLTFFSRTHGLSIGGGPAMPVILETGEVQPIDGRRAWVKLSRPLGDTASGELVTIAVGHRERIGDPVAWEPPVAVNPINECPQRCTGRYLRFRLTVQAGSQFRHLQGIDVQLKPEARLR